MREDETEVGLLRAAEVVFEPARLFLPEGVSLFLRLTGGGDVAIDGAHFAAIDSDIATAGETQEQRDAFWQEQTRWLEDDLRRAQKADFRFVFAHHPPMTAVRIRQGENPHMAALEPLFEKYKLSAGLFGHDHNYQHYLKNGIHYFITGGGGAPLYDVDVPPP